MSDSLHKVQCCIIDGLKTTDSQLSLSGKTYSIRYAFFETSLLPCNDAIITSRGDIVYCNDNGIFQIVKSNQKTDRVRISEEKDTKFVIEAEDGLVSVSTDFVFRLKGREIFQSGPLLLKPLYLKSSNQLLVSDASRLALVQMAVRADNEVQIETLKILESCEVYCMAEGHNFILKQTSVIFCSEGLFFLKDKRLIKITPNVFFETGRTRYPVHVETDGNTLYTYNTDHNVKMFTISCEQLLIVESAHETGASEVKVEIEMRHKLLGRPLYDFPVGFEKRFGFLWITYKNGDLVVLNAASLEAVIVLKSKMFTKKVFRFTGSSSASSVSLCVDDWSLCLREITEEVIQ